MKVRKASWLVMVGLLVSLLAGCASSAPFQKANVESGKALVYVFRPNSPLARGEMFKLEMNGVMQGMLLNNAYLPLQANPGEVTLTTLSNKLVSKPLASLTLTTQPGGTYYVKAEPGLAWTVKMLQLDEAQGAQEIASKHLYKQ